MHQKSILQLTSAALLLSLFVLSAPLPSLAVDLCWTGSESIPDLGSVEVTIVNDRPGNIANLSVHLRISHTYVSDLKVELEHVDTGTAISLIDRVKIPGTPCSGDNVDVYLDDEAGWPVEDHCSVSPPSIGGSLEPHQALSNFNGQSIAGTWRLRVSDEALFDSGAIDTFCLIYNFDHDGDGIFDGYDNCPNHANATQTNSDLDGYGDACDACPTISLKTQPGVCGCLEPDIDPDGDGDIDCGLANPAYSMLSGVGVLLVPFSRDGIQGVMAFDPVSGKLVDDGFIADSINLNVPSCAILSPDLDSIIVSDIVNNAVFEYGFDGAFKGKFAPYGSGYIPSPQGMFVDESDYLWVVLTDSHHEGVQIYDRNGVFVEDRIGPEPAALTGPIDIMLAGEYLLVSDFVNDTIARFNAETGAFINNLASSVGSPSQMIIGSNGHIYAGSINYASVREFRADGAFVQAIQLPKPNSVHGVYELDSGDFLVAGEGIRVLSHNEEFVDRIQTGIPNSFQMVHFAQLDADGDGTGDGYDGCVNDANKTAPGQCGCGVVEDTADTDGDGIFNCADPDDDNDGIDDSEESALGTDSLVADSDGDGVSDGQEVADGSNPMDRGSVLPVLSQSLCSEWNGFLGGMWNIFEHVNMGSSNLRLQTQLYSLQGQSQHTEFFSLPAGRQQDLLVHMMPGWISQSYGKVCTVAANGSPGDLDGRMVYYKPAPGAAPPDYAFQFAFAMPLLNGTAGSQFVPFNTYQPSLDPADSANLVTNWIQLTNLENSSQSGELIFYNQSGSEIGSERVSLSGGMRRDFSGHQFGTNLVGLVEWRPDSAAARFQLRNVRYLFDNPGYVNSFTSAFQLEGLVGSGEELVLPLDTSSGSSIIEIGNVLNENTTVIVAIYDALGNQVDSSNYPLTAKQSLHIITDSLLNGAKGIAVVSANKANSVVAVVMQYERTPSAGIVFLYGIAGRQALGTTLRGSYNTYLAQGCRLLLANPTGSAVSVNLGMTRWDGISMLSGHSISVPGPGLVDYDLCANEEANYYGVVTVHPAQPNSIAAHVIRTGKNNSYRFPTPVRQ